MEEITHIVERWLKDFAYTMATGNIDKHLDMVSKRLQVIGISDRGFLEYREWAERRRNDMHHQRLLRLRYQDMVLKSYSDKRITFRIEETIKGTHGEHYMIDKDIVIEKERDGKWRAVEELIHHVSMFPVEKNEPSPGQAGG